MSVIILFKLLLFSTLYYSGFSQNALPERMDSLLNSKNPRGFNGVVLVSQNGKVKYEKAIGLAKSEGIEPLNSKSKFVLLSNSKQITAVLILREVDRGRINLDQTIKHYLPNFPQKWTDSVTVHQLLNHTSGIVSFEKPLATVPGTTFKYTDLNYMLLGKIIAAVTHTSYEKAVDDLFKKCGMKNSGYPNEGFQIKAVNGFSFSENNEKTEVKTYLIVEDRIPAAGLISTVGDLAKWNQKLHGGKTLKPETYKKMVSYNTLSQHNVFGEKAIGYGYGIRINDKAEIKEYGHTGIVPEQGFTSVNLYYPKTKTSIIVLENQTFDDFSISYYFEAEVRRIVLESGILE
ncbi:class A beta-lactamase-related serine hydrolase [Lacihabitans sp. LS3-19]|uniref:serine hydrolase domain-containing protein n=1 Tax=Lacihabitans sp. LS3-19 TaxID=2487335 RepID=UPI0020CF4BFE|nr:serine hydrolase domain-containing protein [Lacihabitans sp. LS3-19]MCP9766549.1 class A beta-lactamase-related serine hydrolase [Lacihabitans sp. LS3-19]